MASKHRAIESEREQLATLGRCLTRLQRIGASTWREEVELAQAWRTLERLERQAREQAAIHALRRAYTGEVDA